MVDIYQPKLEHLLMDPNQGDPSDGVHPPLNPAKLAEIKALVTNAGDPPTAHGFPAGTTLASGLTGTGDSTVLTCFSGAKYFTNDVMIRVTSTIGATPTATYNIFASSDGTTFTAVNHALIATPNTFVATAVTVTTATTAVYRIAGSTLLALKSKAIKVTISANTNVTFAIDAWDFGGIPL